MASDGARLFESLVRKGRSSIGRRGFWGSMQWAFSNRSYYLSRYCSPVWSLGTRCAALLERNRFGTDTAGLLHLDNLDIGSRNRHRGMSYEPTRQRRIHKALRALAIHDHRDWTFIDLGSGKGRVLLAAAALPFAKIIGVEFSPELNAIAGQNIANYRGHVRCPRIELVCADAAEWRFPDGKLIVYLYNPFDVDVLMGVRANLEMSLRAHHRDVYVIYVTPAWKEIFDESSLFTPHRSSWTLGIWRTREPGRVRARS